MNFGNLPGKYQIPKGDGQYFIWSDDYGKFKISMQVSGNGKAYTHDLTHYR
jgi:hypothetical protein